MESKIQGETVYETKTYNGGGHQDFQRCDCFHCSRLTSRAQAS